MISKAQRDDFLNTSFQYMYQLQVPEKFPAQKKEKELIWTHTEKGVLTTTSASPSENHDSQGMILMSAWY